MTHKRKELAQKDQSAQGKEKEITDSIYAMRCGHNDSINIIQWYISDDLIIHHSSNVAYIIPVSFVFQV